MRTVMVPRVYGLYPVKKVVPVKSNAEHRLASQDGKNNLKAYISLILQPAYGNKGLLRREICITSNSLTAFGQLPFCLSLSPTGFRKDIRLIRTQVFSTVLTSFLF